MEANLSDSVMKMCMIEIGISNHEWDSVTPDSHRSIIYATIGFVFL